VWWFFSAPSPGDFATGNAFAEAFAMSVRLLVAVLLTATIVAAGEIQHSIHPRLTQLILTLPNVT